MTATSMIDAPALPLTRFEYLVVPLKDAKNLKRDEDAFAPEQLNELGEDGWEAVGITPRTHYDRGGGPGGWDSFTFVVLLKRLRPATDMMRS